MIEVKNFPTIPYMTFKNTKRTLWMTQNNSVDVLYIRTGVIMDVLYGRPKFVFKASNRIFKVNFFLNHDF